MSFFFFLIFGREEKRSSLAASVLLKIKEDCTLLLLLTDTVKNNVSEIEPKQRKVCSSLSSIAHFISLSIMKWPFFLELAGRGNGLLHRIRIFLCLLFSHLQGKCYLHRWIHWGGEHEIDHLLFFPYGNPVCIFLFFISDVRGKKGESYFSVSLLIGFFHRHRVQIVCWWQWEIWFPRFGV